MRLWPIGDECVYLYILHPKLLSVFKYITSKPLWVNLLAAGVLLLLLLLLFLGLLNPITRHGKIIKIPAVTGQSFAEAKKTLEQEGFDVQIQDSLYYDTLPPLQVIRQIPEADNFVKVHRTVYLTVNQAIPPYVDMPNLVSMTFRTAIMVLAHYRLKLKDTIFKPDFAKNSVLDQMLNNESIKPGTKIQQGSSITLVLGNGIGGMDFAVPDLVGMTYREARVSLEAQGVTLGAVVPDNDVQDTLGGYIYRQSPPQYDEEKRLSRIRQGQTIDIWLSLLKPGQPVDSAQIRNP
jgi:eukaryotic-like serine/threonine-protein kinase